MKYINLIIKCVICRKNPIFILHHVSVHTAVHKHGNDKRINDYRMTNTNTTGPGYCFTLLQFVHQEEERLHNVDNQTA